MKNKKTIITIGIVIIVILGIFFISKNNQIIKNIVSQSAKSLIARLSGEGTGGDNNYIKNPIDKVVGLGETATFSVDSFGVASYQWQYSTNNGSSWTNVTSAQGTGGTTASFTTVASTDVMNEYQYRCVATFGNGGTVVSTKSATLTVNIVPTVIAGEVATVNSEYTDGTDIAIIPKDFKVSSNLNEQTIETGLVVLDGNDNEWVWIPVDDVTEMYTTDEAPYTLRGDTGVTSSMASKSEIISGRTRIKPGKNTSPYFREPDLVGSGTTSYDYSSLYYGQAGFTSLQEMAQSFADDYEEMIESIGEYGGFYVGRYELTGTVNSPTEVSGTSLVNVNWYNLYNACKKFTTNEVESRMIWGCQFDIVCKYISERGSKVNLNYLSKWGNFKNAEVKSSDGNSIIKASGTSSILDTGITTFTMANNIYDIAGNFYEYTQEAASTGNREIMRRLL